MESSKEATPGVSDDYAVDGFVHVGCDALGVLRQTHDDLGVPA